MGTFAKVLSAIILIGIVWLCYRAIRNNPEAFSKSNLQKSFRTTGLLALVLIAFIGFLIFLTNHS